MNHGSYCNCDYCKQDKSHNYLTDEDSYCSQSRYTESYDIHSECTDSYHPTVRRCHRHRNTTIQCPGAPGATGATGAQGISGAPGTTGAQGVSGTGGQGTTGLDGPQGAQGATGEGGGGTGAQGAVGAQGPQGDPGMNSGTGPQGAQGDAGPPGQGGSNVTLDSTGGGVNIVNDGMGPELAVKSLIGGNCVDIVDNGNDVTINFEGVPVYYEPEQQCQKFDCIQFDFPMAAGDENPPGTVIISLLGMTVSSNGGNVGNYQTLNFTGFTSVVSGPPGTITITK